MENIQNIVNELKATKDKLDSSYLPIIRTIDVGTVRGDIGTAAVTAGVYNVNFYNSVLFIADDDYEVTSISEVHENIATDAVPPTLMVTKLTGTTAPGDGILHLITDLAYTSNTGVLLHGLSLKSAVNTVQSATLTSIASSLALTAGDRLVYGINGTLSTTRITLQVNLKRI